MSLDAETIHETSYKTLMLLYMCLHTSTRLSHKLLGINFVSYV